jgi:hypothetical protein
MNENFELDNQILCEFFHNPYNLERPEILNKLLNNTIFTAKMKESLDYYKPRDPNNDITQNSLFLQKPIGSNLKDILFEFSIEYVKYINLERIFSTIY